MMMIFLLIRLGMLIATLLLAGMGAQIIRHSSSIPENLKQYLLLLFIGLFMANSLDVVIQVGFGWIFTDMIVIGLATSSKLAELIAVSSFVLYLLGIVNGRRN